MIYGYARVSSATQIKGNSLEEQTALLREHGAIDIRHEQYTGTSLHRPVFDALLSELQPGDTLMVTKLDRLARNAPEASILVRDLVGKHISVHILNMGIANNTPMGKLMVTILAAFAEYERDMIIERTQAGKAVARTKAGYREGRPKKYAPEQIAHAMQLLESHSYTQVERMTGISKSTLVREHRRLIRP